MIGNDCGRCGPRSGSDMLTGGGFYFIVEERSLLIVIEMFHLGGCPRESMRGWEKCSDVNLCRCNDM